MKALWKAFWQWFKIRFLDYEWCPECSLLVRPQFIQHPVVFEDEPPLFIEFRCPNPNCDMTTGIQPSCLTEDACRNLGYDSFADYAKKNLDSDR